jgi:hypothetical protein
MGQPIPPPYKHQEVTINHLHVCATHAAKIEGKVKAYGGFDRFGFNNNLKIVQN